MSKEDLDANAALFQQQSTPLLQRFDLETNRELIPPDQYRELMRGLNTKQSDSTLHSYLVNPSLPPSLTQDKLNTLWTKMSNLQLLIIDEVSVVGSNMLLQIDKHLQQLKGKRDDTFGNISILAVGDLHQLRPVAQPHVFAQVGHAYAQLHKSGSLWLDEFKMIKLDKIMRQRGDSHFAQLLCRVCTASCTQEDIKVLESRVITDDHPDYPHDVLHTYPRNQNVDEKNKLKLQEIAPEEQHEVIKSIDRDKDEHTQMLDLRMPDNKAKTGGLVSELCLAVGGKVMLTVKVDVSDGLVNGARGTVKAII